MQELLLEIAEIFEVSDPDTLVLFLVCTGTKKLIPIPDVNYLRPFDEIIVRQSMAHLTDGLERQLEMEGDESTRSTVLPTTLNNKDVQNLQQFSGRFKKWCKKQGFRTNQERKETYLPKQDVYVVAWTCKERSCAFKVKYRRLPAMNSYELDLASTNLNHNGHALKKNYVSMEGKGPGTCPNVMDGPMLITSKATTTNLNPNMKSASGSIRNSRRNLQKDKYGPKEKDAYSLIEYLSRAHDFYYDYRLDQENRLTHLVGATTEMLGKLKSYSTCSSSMSHIRLQDIGST